jgi:hypothetical protein
MFDKYSGGMTGRIIDGLRASFLAALKQKTSDKIKADKTCLSLQDIYFREGMDRHEYRFVGFSSRQNPTP